MSLSVDRLQTLLGVMQRSCVATLSNRKISNEYADVATAIRELIAIKERQAKPVHSCEIPGCASCGNPPDRYDDFDEDLQALMDRDMED